MNRERKNVPSSGWLFQALAVYALVAALCYLVWRGRSSEYEENAEPIRRKRQEMFYVRSSQDWRFDSEKYSRLLLDRLEEEKASGTSLTIEKGVLFEDTWVRMREIKDFLAFALSHGVTTATFEKGLFPPLYETTSVRLVARMPGLAARNAAIVRVYEDTVEVNGMQLPFDRYDYCWKRFSSGRFASEYEHLDEFKKLLGGPASIKVFLEIHEFLNLDSLHGFGDILEDCGMEVILVVGTDSDESQYVMVCNYEDMDVFPIRLSKDMVGKGQAWEKVVQWGKDEASRPAVIFGQGLTYADMDNFAEKLDNEGIESFILLNPSEPRRDAGKDSGYPKPASVSFVTKGFQSQDPQKTLSLSLTLEDGDVYARFGVDPIILYEPDTAGYYHSRDDIERYIKTRSNLGGTDLEKVLITVWPNVRVNYAVDVALFFNSMWFHDIYFIRLTPHPEIPEKREPPPPDSHEPGLRTVPSDR